MMKRIRRFKGSAVAAFFLAACGTNNSGGEVSEPITDPPTAAVLMALERQANEAYARGDAAFFQNLLSNQFVMLGPDGQRMDKTAATAMIAGVKCEVKDSTLDEASLSRVDADTYVLTYRSTFDGICTRDGMTEKPPSPVRAATVWVRRGEKWRAAFHGENPIFAPQTAETRAAGHADPDRDHGATPGAQPAPAADPFTDSLVAIEKSIWEAWKARDAKALEALTAKDLAFVDIFGNVTSGKAETIQFWTEHQCDVQSVDVVDGISSPLSPTVAILTFKGILEGTCGGQPFPVIYGTSVYAKEGNAWKAAFTLNHLVSQASG